MQTVGSQFLAAANPARTSPTLVDTKSLGKPPLLKNTEELRREYAPWSERCLDVGRGKRIGNSDRSERSNRSCDASGHSANACRSIAHSADDPRGRRIVRHPCELWTGSLAASTQTLIDDWKSERIAQREILSLGRAKLVELQGAVERLEDLMRRYTQRRENHGVVYLQGEELLAVR